MAKSVERARFQVMVEGIAPGSDESGLWQTVPFGPQPPAGGPSLVGADSVGVQHGSVWRVELPADSRDARQSLRATALRLEHSERLLLHASQRLRVFVGATPPRGAHLLVASEQPEPGEPERELQRWIELTSATVRPEGATQVASLMSPLLPSGWQDIAQQALSLFQRVHQSLVYFARVESAAAGRRLAVSTVSWSGDLRTSWNKPLDIQRAEQHKLSLQLALRTRVMWLRLALLVTRGALQLGLLLPGSALFAVPAAWKFFNDVLAFSREMNLEVDAPQTRSTLHS